MPQHRELRAVLFAIRVHVASLTHPMQTLTPEKMQETGPMDYSPYQRRLERLKFADVITRAEHSPQLF